MAKVGLLDMPDDAEEDGWRGPLRVALTRSSRGDGIWVTSRAYQACISTRVGFSARLLNGPEEKERRR